MADYLEYLAKRGLIRAGPFEGFLATAYQKRFLGIKRTEYMFLSTLYLEYNQDDVNDVPNRLIGERKHIKTFENFILENISDRKPAKEGLLNSHLPKEMKEKILPYITSNSYYKNKKVMDLRMPKVKDKSFYGVSLGANKDGFFVYTHRARSKSYETPL